MLKPNFRLLEEDKGAGGGGGDAGAGAGTGAGDKGAGAGTDGDKGTGAGTGDKGGDKGAGAGTGDGGGDKGAGDWGADWRLKMAGGDEKLAKALDRFASPKDVHTSYRALNQRLSSGELVSKLPKDAKPEDIAKWRTENGIPEKPEAYEMPEGLVVGEPDKAGIGKFLTAMHGENATPAQVKAGIKTYYQIKEDAIAQQAQADLGHMTEVEDTLRAEWGAEYRGNINSTIAFLDMAPEGIKDKLLTARMADGRAVANDPAFMGWLCQVARDVNPVGTVVPAGGDQMGAISSEITKIESLMGDRKSAYWKGPESEKMQARLRDLYTARDKRAEKK
jgi:hypothetical protein